MSTFHTRTKLLLIGGFAVTLQHAPTVMAQLQCDDDAEALLRVTYFLAIDQWNYDLIDQRLVVRPSGNVGTLDYSDTVDYYSPEDVVDFERCIPREGACLEVTVAQLPPDSYTISWDDQAVDTGGVYKGEYTNFTSTEVGDYCVPVCNDDTDSAVFEYKYQAAAGFEDYRVEDVDGNPVMECDSSSDKCQEDYYNVVDSVHTNRVCLKRDACYTFITGDNFQRIPGYEWHDAIASTSSLRWDDEVLEKSASKLFDAVEFGDSCERKCNGEESLVHFFMHRITSYDGCENDPDFTWEVKVMKKASATWNAVSNGVVAACSDTSLHHQSICVPKDACVSFTVTSSKAHEFMVPLYTLTLDGIVYRRKQILLDETSSDFEGLTQKTFMGSCAVTTLCDTSNQALLEVDVMAPSEHNYNNVFLPAIPGAFNWLVASRNTSSTFSLKSNTFFDGETLDLGAVYKTIECVPERCGLAFEITATVTESTTGTLLGLPISYTVKLDSIEDPQVEEGNDVSSDALLFGEDCTLENDGEAGSADNPQTSIDVEDTSIGDEDTSADIGEADHADQVKSAGNKHEGTSVFPSAIASVFSMCLWLTISL